MPFGFWVLGNNGATSYDMADDIVSNAFRLLGSGEQEKRQSESKDSNSRLKCLSAFGFWGTKKPTYLSPLPSKQVSNAFRLLGSGEQDFAPITRGASDPVSNAFRLLGSGEHTFEALKAK